MLNVVVFRTMALIVGFSLFLRMLVSLGPTGSVALLYHCTHYTVRGGNSTAGLYCGSSLVHFAVSPSIYNWHVGAALSFILHIILFAVVLLTLVPIVVCFMFLWLTAFLGQAGVLVLLYHLYFLVHIMLFVVVFLTLVPIVVLFHYLF